MKKFDVKSFAAGVLVGALGLTTAFAATGIKSAALSDTTVTRKGETLAFGKPLVWITMDDEEKPGLYAPVDEVFEKLGYGVHYDSGKNTVDLIPGNCRGCGCPGKGGPEFGQSCRSEEYRGIRLLSGGGEPDPGFNHCFGYPGRVCGSVFVCPRREGAACCNRFREHIQRDSTGERNLEL